VWHLSHGWHMSAGGYAIAPIPPEGPLLDEYIKKWWEDLPPAQRGQPEWAPTRAIRLPILESERELQLGQYYGPYNGRYNMSGRRAYQRRCNIDTMLREHGYRPSTVIRLRHAAQSAPHHPRRRVRRRGWFLRWPLLYALCPASPTAAPNLRYRHPGV
jgi:hypothetical protein